MSAAPCSSSARATAHSWWSSRTRPAWCSRARSASALVLRLAYRWRLAYAIRRTHTPTARRRQPRTELLNSLSMDILRRIHTGLAWVTVAGLVLQFYLAGTGMFGATTFELHRGLGYLVALLILLLLILTLVTRLPTRVLG